MGLASTSHPLPIVTPAPRDPEEFWKVRRTSIVRSLWTMSSRKFPVELDRAPLPFINVLMLHVTTRKLTQESLAAGTLKLCPCSISHTRVIRLSRSVASFPETHFLWPSALHTCRNPNIHERRGEKSTANRTGCTRMLNQERTFQPSPRVGVYTLRCRFFGTPEGNLRSRYSADLMNISQTGLGLRKLQD